MTAQVPLPPASTWDQFPVVAVIVLCLAAALVAIYFFKRWVWSEFKKERDLDRTWRESQNDKREIAMAEQNQLWREAMIERDQRWEEADKEKQVTLKDMAGMMGRMIQMLSEHDLQAKDIRFQVEAIKKEVVRPENRKRSGL
jgi:hypothetical protein